MKIQTWEQFIATLKAFKKDCKSKQLSLDYGSLATLLYCGALDDFIQEEHINLEKYNELAAEMKEALGSEAQPQKARKGESFGLADVDSDLKLMLWRNQTTPLVEFSFANYFKNALRQSGFSQTNRDDFPYQSKKAILVNKWSSLQDDYKVLNYFMRPYPNQFPAFLGMVKSVTTKKIGNGKEMMRFSLFTGFDFVPNITVWSDYETGKLDPKIKAAITEKSYGLATVRLKMYKGEISPTLMEWKSFQCL